MEAPLLVQHNPIISGTLQANVGFESYELGPGDSIVDRCYPQGTAAIHDVAIR